MLSQSIVAVDVNPVGMSAINSQMSGDEGRHNNGINNSSISTEYSCPWIANNMRVIHVTRSICSGSKFRVHHLTNPMYLLQLSYVQHLHTVRVELGNSWPRSSSLSCRETSRLMGMTPAPMASLTTSTPIESRLDQLKT